MGPKTKKPRQMPRLIDREQKTRLSGRVLKASRCVHSNSRCYENRSIPRGKVISARREPPLMPFRHYCIKVLRALSMLNLHHGTISQMTQKNQTFRGASPSWANACVGHNGNPSYVEYSNGFSNAANLLIDQVIKDRSIHLYTDHFVYPVCFNMRHSVELRLKGAIDEITKIAKIKGKTLEFNSSSSHDISIIWNYFKSESEAIDKRYISINQKIEPTILDIAEIDPTGQTFRYPLSNTSQKHLTNVSNINFIVLKGKFNELQDHLNTLHSLNMWLSEEYNYGTFTSKLSRAEIFAISDKLPRKDQWRSPEFSNLKLEIQAAYELSSNDFSKAINIIQTHYTLAPKIADPLPLLGISEEDLLTFIDVWVKENPEIKEPHNHEIDITDYSSSEFFAELISQRESNKRSWEFFADRVSAEFIAGLESLFYFAHEKLMVEYYSRIYPIHLRAAQISLSRDASNLQIDFMHIFTKTNALHNIIASLYALGHNQLAEQAIHTHDLHVAFSWLDDARSGQLFLHPSYSGY